MRIVVDIDLGLTTRRKRLAAVAAVPVLVAGLVAIAYADVPHSWSAGDLLSAADLNANFADLDTRLMTVEDGAVTVTPWTAYTPSVMAGTTPLPFTGSAVWRRVGDSVQVMFDTTITTCQTAGQLHWSLPAGLAPDADLLPGPYQILGVGLVSWSGTVSFPPVAAQGASAYVAVEWPVPGGLHCSHVGDGVEVRGSFTLPIEGWTATN